MTVKLQIPEGSFPALEAGPQPRAVTPTEATDAEAAGAGAGAGAAQLGALVGGVAGAVSPRPARQARFVFEGHNCEQRQNWNTRHG